MAVKPVASRARLTYLPAALHDLDSLPVRVGSYFKALEALDADAASAFFAPDAEVRLPGLAPIAGRAAIRRALVQLSLDVDGLGHAPVQLWSAGNLSVFEADMTLTLPGGATLQFPVTHVLRWGHGFIEDAQVDVYLESRMAVALSAFDRVMTQARAAYAGLPSHKSMGRLTPSGRNGSSILRPCPAEA